MTDPSKFDQETKAYFDSLPAMIQESIMQSDVTITGMQDLKACAENLTKRKGSCCGN